MTSPSLLPVGADRHVADVQRRTLRALVISLRIAAMFLPSPVTGVLVDRLGRRPLIAAAGVTLLAAGLLVATAPPGSVLLLSVALVLLGLGWNLGLVVAATSFAALGLAGGLVALALVPSLLVSRPRSTAAGPPAPGVLDPSARS